MPHFHVRIAGDDLLFSAAHFITLAETVCEPLHGHNYRVSAEVWGPLDDNQYVIDFAALQECLRNVLSQLDHAVLLPTGHPSIRVEEKDSEEGTAEIEVTFPGRRWVFPTSDCRVLPIANTTAELLAQYVGQQLWEELESRGIESMERMRVEIEESPGHWASCEIEGGG